MRNQHQVGINSILNGSSSRIQFYYINIIIPIFIENKTNSRINVILKCTAGPHLGQKFLLELSDVFIFYELLLL